MNRSHSGRCLLMVLAGVFWIGPGSVTSRGQDPFQPPSNTETRQSATKAGPEASGKDGSADSKATAKEPERIFKTNEEWQKLLTQEQFMITRMKTTEAAFSGKYASGHFKGTFLCVCCGFRLFDASHKFESGTGWPSFDRPVSDKALESAMDYSEPAETRVEVTCGRCGSHLGHVFQDGPTTTGLRYCINSIALKLDSEKTTASPPRKPARGQASRSPRRGRSTTPNESGTGNSEKSSQAPEPRS